MQTPSLTPAQRDLLTKVVNCSSNRYLDHDHDERRKLRRLEARGLVTQEKTGTRYMGPWREYWFATNAGKTEIDGIVRCESCGGPLTHFVDESGNGPQGFGCAICDFGPDTYPIPEPPIADEYPGEPHCPKCESTDLIFTNETTEDDELCYYVCGSCGAQMWQDEIVYPEPVATGGGGGGGGGPTDEDQPAKKQGYISGKPNKYMRPISEEEKNFWQGKPEWFRNRNQWRFYERIDLGALEDDLENNKDVVNLIWALVDYIRIRDQVIEHRHATMINIARLLNTMQRNNQLSDYIRGQLDLIETQLQQMTAVSGLEPEPPTRDMSDPHKSNSSNNQ